MPKRCFQNLLLRPVVRRQSARISARLSSITSGRQLLAGIRRSLADNATMQTEPSKASHRTQTPLVSIQPANLLIVGFFAPWRRIGKACTSTKVTNEAAANLIVSEGGFVLYDYGSKSLHGVQAGCENCSARISSTK